ncbi:hypothetical protein J6590_041483 [Homalodisca vitripennis]|nr:hypothetical protein J6590_041483 [Homalodisca vitripennis]
MELGTSTSNDSSAKSYCDESKLRVTVAPNHIVMRVNYGTKSHCDESKLRVSAVPNHTVKKVNYSSTKSHCDESKLPVTAAPNHIVTRVNYSSTKSHCDESKLPVTAAPNHIVMRVNYRNHSTQNKITELLCTADFKLNRLLLTSEISCCEITKSDLGHNTSAFVYQQPTTDQRALANGNLHSRQKQDAEIKRKGDRNGPFCYYWFMRDELLKTIL